mmetsp:Transcript_8136/g.12157  ORF Transcript_8136/g.12157 Transcript_8136/m.12157 type:complete len:158 (-) Transcript_8136:622-1095(-)
MEQMDGDTTENNNIREAVNIPDGRPKSGRVWKVKKTVRTSAHCRKGVLSHLAKTFDERQAIRQKLALVKEVEKEMLENRKERKREIRQRTADKHKRRMENEYKNSEYQVLRPEKLKTMSKKQLRAVRKTSMNQNGQIELVNPWSGRASASDSKKQRK